jgi:AraC-like DNA-binding protein
MLYLSAIVLSFFFSFLLVTKKNKTTADYILVTWLALIGFHLLGFYLLYSRQHTQFATVIGLGVPLPLAHGPMLYLYTLAQTSPGKFKVARLLHFLPLLLSYVLFASFFLLPHEQKVEVFTLKGKGFEWQSQINLYAIFLSGIIYTALSLRQLVAFRRELVNRFSNTEKISFNWLLYLIMWIVVIWLTIILLRDDRLIFGAAALFVLWLGYFGIKQVQVFVHPSVTIPATSSEPARLFLQKNDTVAAATSGTPAKVKYQRSSLSDENAALIHGRLLQLMEQEKPFMNAELTLEDLAASLKVHPNTLSQVINVKEQKNFYDLVNERRIEEFTRRVSLDAAQQYTFLGLAFECGFNSKASFNRNFKKYTGTTPSEYLKRSATVA